MNNKKKGLIGAVVVVVVMIVLIVIYTGKKQDTLDAFTGTIETTPEETETPYDGVLETYSDYDMDFSIGVPEGWRYVDVRGTASFIHQPSSSSLQIEVTDYDPKVSTVTANDIMFDLGDMGTLNNFSWTGNSSYAAAYQKKSETGAVSNCLEFVHFDRNNIVRLTYIVPEQYYDRLSKDVAASIDSFQWNKADPFPEGTFIVYSGYGDYEFVVPSSWNSGSTDTSYYAQDPVSGAEMSVRCTETDSDFSDVTQVAFVNAIAASYNNYMLQNYAGDSHRIYASATYYSGDTQCYMVQYFLTSGKHEYSMYLSCPAATYSQEIQADFDTLMGCFRYFEQDAVFDNIIPEETIFPTELSTQPAGTPPADSTGTPPTDDPSTPPADSTGTPPDGTTETVGENMTELPGENAEATSGN